MLRIAWQKRQLGTTAAVPGDREEKKLCTLAFAFAAVPQGARFAVASAERQNLSDNLVVPTNC
jgi:hypothetical protein